MLDVTVRRNGYGRQRDSFEAPLDGRRARRRRRSRACSSARRVVERVGAGVEVLADARRRPGARPRRARSGSRRFHPELSGDLRLHQRFVNRRSRARCADVRSFQVAFDQAQEGRGRRRARQALRGARSARSRSRRARGGGDADGNPTLRTMVQKARDASLPIDTIQRAIKRGTGEEEGVTYEPVTYEGYAPDGVAVYRAGAHRQPQPHRRRDQEHLQPQRRLVRRAGRGGVAVRAQGHRDPRQGGGDEDELMLAAADAGAEDIADQRRHVAGHDRRRPTCTRCAPRSRRPGIKVTVVDLTMIPTHDRRARRGAPGEVGAARDRRARGARRRRRPSTPTSTSPTRARGGHTRDRRSRDASHGGCRVQSASTTGRHVPHRRRRRRRAAESPVAAGVDADGPGVTARREHRDARSRNLAAIHGRRYCRDLATDVVRRRGVRRAQVAVLLGISPRTSRATRRGREKKGFTFRCSPTSTRPDRGLRRRRAGAPTSPLGVRRRPAAQGRLSPTASSIGAHLRADRQARARPARSSQRRDRARLMSAPCRSG